MIDTNIIKRQLFARYATPYNVYPVDAIQIDETFYGHTVSVPFGVSIHVDDDHDIRHAVTKDMCGIATSYREYLHKKADIHLEENKDDPHYKQNCDFTGPGSESFYESFIIDLKGAKKMDKWLDNLVVRFGKLLEEDKDDVDISISEFNHYLDAWRGDYFPVINMTVHKGDIKHDVRLILDGTEDAIDVLFMAEEEFESACEKADLEKDYPLSNPLQDDLPY